MVTTFHSFVTYHLYPLTSTRHECDAGELGCADAYSAGVTHGKGGGVERDEKEKKYYFELAPWAHPLLLSSISTTTPSSLTIPDIIAIGMK